MRRSARQEVFTMGETKSFSQNKFGLKLAFDLDDDMMSYKLRDYSGELRFPVPYEGINVHEPSSLVVNNAPFVQKLFVIPTVSYRGRRLFEC
jgi:hypothetical protein